MTGANRGTEHPRAKGRRAFPVIGRARLTGFAGVVAGSPPIWRRILAWLALVWFSPALTVLAASLTRGPYLQNGSSTNLTVRWRTDVATDSVVRYGTNLAHLDRVTRDARSVTEHQIELPALRPATAYFYSIGSSDATLAGADADHFFVTAPLPGTAKPTRLWVLGDSGTGLPGQVAVRDAYAAFTRDRHTDLWLMLGDNAYPDGTDGDYQEKLFNLYTNTLPTSVLWPALGNHDVRAPLPGGTYAYFEMFTLPTNGAAGGVPSGTEHYYSFDHGNLHFICLDSMESDRTTNGPMYAWLTNDLARVTANWCIAYWHHSPYSKGSRNSDFDPQSIEMRRVFLPLLEAGGVDLVLSGHSHDYERSFLLDGHYGSSGTLQATNKLDAGSGRADDTGAYQKPQGQTPHQGTVYVVAGSAGENQLGILNHPAMYISLRGLGSLVLDIAGDRLDATFISSTGTTNARTRRWATPRPGKCIASRNRMGPDRPSRG